MTRGVARSRRAGQGVAAAVLACLALGACSPAGGSSSQDAADGAATGTGAPGAAAPGTDPAAATTAAPVHAYPDPLDDEEVLALVTAMDAALQSGDADAFLGHVDPALVEGQRAWFEAVSTVPMDVRQLRPDRVVSRSSPTGTVLHVALRHQVSGADAVPVVQQYRWVLAPGDDGRPRLVEVGGRNGLFNGHPQLWDLGPVAVLEAQDVILLAPEEARADAEAMLEGVSEAAQHLRRDFPTLGRDREVLTVQLVPPEDVADMLDTFGDDLAQGTSWLRTSREDPGLGRLGLPPPEPTLDHRLLLDLELAVEDHELFGPGPAGNGLLRGPGASAAVLGGRESHVAVGWLLAGVPPWYELEADPELEELLLMIAADAHVDGPPTGLPDPVWGDQDEEAYLAASVSLLRFLEETYGREETLGVVEALHDVDGWYDEVSIWPTVEATLGVGEEELLTGWRAWGEELLTRVEPWPTDALEG